MSINDITQYLQQLEGDTKIHGFYNHSSLLPTSVIEENAKFQVEISENKYIFLSPSSDTTYG